MRVIHQRLWWMELGRGSLSIAFSLLLLIAWSHAMLLFIYSLGVYLVIDGALEFYGVYRKMRVFRYNAFDLVGAAASLFTGLFSLLIPKVALFLLAYIIAIRIIATGFSLLRTARRSHNTRTGFQWLYGIFFVLLGIFPLLFPSLAIAFLVVLLGIYTFVVGLYLLLRGLSLRFKTGRLPTSLTQTAQAPPGLNNDLFPSTRRAIVFVRRTAADGFGHIAWAFEWTNGWFNTGSVENIVMKPFTNPEEMGFWSTHTLDPIATMQKQKHPYDEYKIFTVPQPRPKDAWKTVVWESQEPYSVVHHNCNDVVYDILRAYGCTELIDPAMEYVPNDWYDALPGASYSIEAYPAIPLYLHRQSQREVATREIALAIPSRMKGSPPPWRMRRWRAWEEFTLVSEKMIGHVRTLFTSGIKLIEPLLHRKASHS